MRAYTLAKEIDEVLTQLPAVETGRCWFCRRLLKKGQRVSRHHVVSRRYAKRAKVSVLVVRTHAFCHVLWHAMFDRSGSRKWRHYKNAMRRLNYGYAIFAHAGWLKKGETPPQLRSEFWQPYHPRLSPHPRLGMQGAA